MERSLPEMGEWDDLFDETYLESYVPFLDEERTRQEALGAAELAGLEPGAEVLDCPVGFGRHALVLVEAGYRVTGVDRSAVQLAEAERRRGASEWPRLVRGDYRRLPFADDSFDGVLTLFTSLGYLDRSGDVGVLRELRRVLRPGKALVLETMHRDRLARTFVERAWDRLPDGTLFLQERLPDWSGGTIATLYLLVRPDGTRSERRYTLTVYTVGEWVAMLREAGFVDVDAFSSWAGDSPPSPEARLILRAR